MPMSFRCDSLKAFSIAVLRCIQPKEITISRAMLASVLLIPVTVSFHAQPAAGTNNACFLTTQFRHWKAPDDKTLYISVLPDRYYRLALSGRCPALRWPDAHLVTVFRGSNTVCSAVDWDLKVSQGSSGISEPCIVRSMTLLSPAEARAIPPEAKPSQY
jgi:hypothetical protein